MYPWLSPPRPDFSSRGVAKPPPKFVPLPPYVVPTVQTGGQISLPTPRKWVGVPVTETVVAAAPAGAAAAQPQSLGFTTGFSPNIETFKSIGQSYFSTGGETPADLSQWATFPAVATVVMDGNNIEGATDIATTRLVATESITAPVLNLLRSGTTPGTINMTDNNGTNHTLDSQNGDLYFDNELLAKAGDIQDIADWALYPAIADVAMNGKKLEDSTGANFLLLNNAGSIALTSSTASLALTGHTTLDLNAPGTMSANIAGQLGTAGQVLTSDGAQHVVWADLPDPPDPGVTSVNTVVGAVILEPGAGIIIGPGTGPQDIKIAAPTIGEALDPPGPQTAYGQANQAIADAAAAQATADAIEAAYVTKVGLAGNQRSGEITLVPGANTTITEAPNGTFTFASNPGGGVTSVNTVVGAVILEAGAGIIIGPGTGPQDIKIAAPTIGEALDPPGPQTAYGQANQGIADAAAAEASAAAAQAAADAAAAEAAAASAAAATAGTAAAAAQATATAAGTAAAAAQTTANAAASAAAAAEATATAAASAAAAAQTTANAAAAAAATAEATAITAGLSAATAQTTATAAGVTATAAASGVAAIAAAYVTKVGLAGVERSGQITLAAGANTTITEAPNGTFTIASTPSTAGVTSLNSEVGALTLTSANANIVVGSTGAGNIELSAPTPVTSLNTLAGPLTLVGGAGVSITPAGSNITIATTGAASVFQATYYKSANQNLLPPPGGSTDITFDLTAAWNNDGGYITHVAASTVFTVVQAGLYQLEWNAAVAPSGATWNAGTVKIASIDITRIGFAEQIAIGQTFAGSDVNATYIQNVCSSFYLDVGDIINLRLQTNNASATPICLGVGTGPDLNTWFTWRYISAAGNASTTTRAASFSSTATQTVSAVNTVTPITYDTTDLNTGGFVQSGATVRVPSTGTYEVIPSLQLNKTGGGQADIFFWAQKSSDNVTWTDVANSSTEITIASSGNSLVGTVPLIMALNANDYFRIVFASGDAGSQVLAAAAQATPFVRPGNPSIITTVKLLI